MKKLNLAVLIAAALLGSCSLLDKGAEDGGSVDLNFALAAVDSGPLSSVRVWVYSDNILVEQSDGQDYHSAPLSGGKGSVTIEDLPPGDGYRLVVAAGGASGGRFVTTKYGMSSSFTVQSGAETGVSLTLSDIDTAYDAEVGALKSVVVDGATIYAASGSTIFSGGTLDDVETGGTAWLTGPRGTINSLSLGDTGLLVNTTNGVYASGGAVLVGNENLDPPGALQSGSYDGVYFYQGENEFGGFAAPETTWTRIDLDIDGLAGKPVLDFVVLDNAGTTYAYFATKFVGAFRVSETFLDEVEDPELSEILDPDSGYFAFFGQNLPLTQALGYYAGNGTLYLGTRNGAYRSAVSSGVSALASSPVQVPGTQGLDITKIIVNDEGVVAMLSASELVVVKDSKVYRMPFVTGLVGNLTDIAWNDTTVIVTGSAGIGEVGTDSL